MIGSLAVIPHWWGLWSYYSPIKSENPTSYSIYEPYDCYILIKDVEKTLLYLIQICKIAYKLYWFVLNYSDNFQNLVSIAALIRLYLDEKYHKQIAIAICLLGTEE